MVCGQIVLLEEGEKSGRIIGKSQVHTVLNGLSASSFSAGKPI